MASFASRKLLARDIIAYNDAELDQYLEENHLNGGALAVDIVDPENLPESFIQRLSAGHAVQSRPLDLNQLNARLLEIPADNTISPRPSSRESDRKSLVTLPPIPPEEYERGYYNKLISDGGRPLYPIDFLDERLQPAYDEAWKTLVASKVLRRSETEEDILDIKSAFQRQIKEDRAWRTVKSARSVAKAVLASVQKDINDPRGSRLGKQARIRMMSVAKSKLDAAKESLKLIKRRNDLISEFHRTTRDYQIVKSNADRRSIRLQWILDQVPLVEAELNKSKAAETASDAVRGTKRRLGRDHGESMQDRSTKKRRRDSGVPGSPPDRNAGSGPQGERLKHSRDDVVDDMPPSKRFRNGREDLGSY
ncbi:hypothetical protein MKZ38_004799 [Zalerion maritima]|uniref:Uncharacterized protein n=1 Tax=Zalerion maritima TaxID=339359 RepID=A0AAD5RL73_9PEZI|nr:hypothetical protein MKZ38_004799 [Zalerion maritima]